MIKTTAAKNLAGWLCLAAAAASPLAARAADGLDFFETKIRPVLAEHCYECHGQESKKAKGNLFLDSREGILRGGESGAAITPGNPGKSLLLTAVGYLEKDLQMPPPKGGVPRKLPDAVVADLTLWVKIGAPMPDGPAISPAIGNRAENHWAFHPPKGSTVPGVRNPKWPKNTVDHFILSTLEKNGLRPAPAADRRTLVRRATFDLTGLPPRAEEVEDFLADRSADAYSKLVERLLASPAYGERAARRWLDLARYADTKGYVYGREERHFVHAWTYRDWVVRAMNQDLPYDRFLQLQIAADQLVGPDSPDLAAMGFLTGGRRFLGVAREIIDDRIDTVTRATMGLTVACARCHDHKYDPIPTRDYYSLYGVFDASTEQLVSLAPEPTDNEFLKRKNKLADTMKKRREEAESRLRNRVADYLAAQLELHKYPEEGFDQIFSDSDLLPASVRRWRDYLHRTKDGVDPIFAPWHALSKPPAENSQAPDSAAPWDPPVARLNPIVAQAFARKPQSLREAAEIYGRIFAGVEKSGADGAKELVAFLRDPRSPTVVPDTGIINNEQFFTTAVLEDIWKLQGEVDRWLIQNDGSPPHALVMRDREPERDPRIFIRGNPARQGDEVRRQFLGVIDGPARRPFQHGSGRLELALAITRPDNPLTARVMVNRLWQDHFGTGLVRTTSDFGLRAEPPSHPGLLDWLALEFIKENWSLKGVHRLIMLSAAYQQSSLGELPRHDPENRLLSQFPRARLDFEQMRDAMLASSGELEPRMGGRAADLLKPANKRRTIYSLVDRQFLPQTFRAFDFANPDIHVGQRHGTTVPQQALFFLNHPFVADRARALASAAENWPAEQRVAQMYRWIYQRPPTRHETSAALRFIASSASDSPTPTPKNAPPSWQYGWGEYDPAEKKVKGFTPLPHFTGKAWQGGPNFPDPKLGWLQLTADGGHPGNDLKHAVIRRWIAPRDCAASIGGSVANEPDAGDGIRAFIVHSRNGELKSATPHHSRSEMNVPNFEVKEGDTLDFIVDLREKLNSDQFLWAPIIALQDANGVAIHSARSDFAGPLPPRPDPLQPWAQYAQALLLANEFSFVD